MAFDRKTNLNTRPGNKGQDQDKELQDPLKEFINNEIENDELGEEAENEQKRKEAMTERD